MESPDLTKFQQRLAERKAKQEAQQLEQPEGFEEDLIPDQVYERNEADQAIDDILGKIDIIDAYKRWCGKMVPTVRGNQRENIMVSCPIPGHTDSRPSAWVNLDKQAWHCGTCEQGGDKYDIAAYGLGFDVPGYKIGADFHRLRQRMAEDYGYTVTRLAGGSVSIKAPVILPEEPNSESQNGHHTQPPDSSVVTALFEELDNPDDFIGIPSLDWRPLCPNDSFLYEYMVATSVDDVPEEYHFFHALIALGLALGKDVSLFDSVPVYGNLFVCTLGRSGTGKSKARKHLDRLLAAALPYNRASIPSKGVMRVNAPGSAESLIYQFMAPVEDPTNPKNILYFAPVRALIDFNELSALMGRTNRQGSVMKPTLMQFYDMDPIIQTTSMTTGSKEAHEPFGSAITTSQPRALRDLISSSDDASGFLNRWLFIPGKEKKRYSVGGVAVDMVHAVKPLQDIQGWAATFRTGECVEWSEPALVMFDKFFQEVLEPTRKAAQNDLLVRVDLTLKKMILLFAANRKEKTVSEQSVIDALYCYEYIKSAYGIPEAQIGNTIHNEMSEAVLTQIQKNSEKGKTGVTLRQICDSLKRRKYDKKKLVEVIDTLAKLDLIEVEATKAGAVGRPTKRYKYVG